MTDREELRKLIDVIEKASSSVQMDQAIEDIKTFANTASFLANKLEARLKGGEVKAKKRPKSRIGKAIAPPPTPRPTAATSTAPTSSTSSGMPLARSTATSQADYERLKPVTPQSTVGPSS